MPRESNKKQVLKAQQAALLTALKTRFKKNIHRRKGLEWAAIQLELQNN